MTLRRRALAFVAATFLAAACGSGPTPSPSPGPTTVADVTTEPTPSDTPSPTDTPTPTDTPLPAGIAPLDGMHADPAVADLLPVAVMIDDNVIARPQSGFNSASIVYQAPADGGEDRYMLVFQELPAPEIGPVRSGRPYFVRWAAEYRAGFGHYGGDQATKDYLPTIDRTLVYDIDALRGAGAAYHRISTRIAPHNAYTSIDPLRSTSRSLGGPSAMVSGLGFRPFVEDTPVAERPASASISVPYYRGAASYTYDPRTDAYLRSVGGAPQYDAADGKRVTARNVVVLFMVLTTDSVSEPGHDRPVLANVGSGKAIVFREGKAIVGTWRKPDVGGLTRFYDSSGNEIPLVRGRIFIQVVPVGTNVTYAAN